MKNLLVFLLFNVLCLSVEGAALEFAFQLGEKQQPRLDRLLPDVAQNVIFDKDSTKLIVQQMGGTIVEWDLQKYQKRVICNIEPDQWSAYCISVNYLLVPKTDSGISVVNVDNGNAVRLVRTVPRSVVNIGDEISGQYKSGDFSPDGQVIALTKGDNEIELSVFSQLSIMGLRGQGSEAAMERYGIHNFRTQLPVRNGVAISPENTWVAAAEGTYRKDEGHRTIIEIWRDFEKHPIYVFNTGEILGVWNLIFSDNDMLFAVDTQRNGQSGIRVWELGDGRQLLNKSGFEAYWTRALAFSPTSDYLASGDEAGNLRVWDLSESESVIWETYLTGIQSLAFSPDGEYLAVALWDATIQILHWRKKNNE